MTRAKFDRAAYISDLEANVCRVLSDLHEQDSMTRRAIGRTIYGEGHTGSTVLASVLGTLKTKGYVEDRLPAFRERGDRYALTSLGRLAVSLVVALEEGAA